MLLLQIADARKVDEKCQDALLMLGDLELKNDDWVKAKETFRAAKDMANGNDSYASLCLVHIFLRIHLFFRCYIDFLLVK